MMRGFLIFLSILLFSGPVFGNSGIDFFDNECAGCHSKDHRQPIAVFPSGLSKWTDSQCVGCHAEINAISSTLKTVAPKKLNFRLPLSLEKQKELSEHPLSLGSAPVFELNDLRSAKYDYDGVMAYVLNPPAVRSKMPSFPHLSRVLKNKFTNLTSESVSPYPKTGQGARYLGENQDFSGGRDVFENKGCIACHGDKGSAPHFLGFDRLSAKFLSNLVRGIENSGGRTMPVIELSYAEAQQIKDWVRNERSKRIREMELRFAKLQNTLMIEQKSVPNGFSDYVFGRFLFEGTCVHCHGTIEKAKAVFDGSASGLKTYLRNGGAPELLKRLRTRQVEVEVGLVSNRPGMPMNGSPLPNGFVDALEQWISAGCLQDSLKHCSTMHQKDH
jgi:hypothetical protein